MATDERAMLEPTEELPEVPTITDELVEPEETVIEDDGIVDGQEEIIEETVEAEEEEPVNEEEPILDSLYQQLKKRDPKLLKEMPELRTTIFREQRFTEMFPTIEDAEAARDAADVFEQYQADLASGNSGPLLEALDKSDKKALESFVAGFLPTLEEKNQDLYFKVVYPQFKRLLRAAAASNREEYSIAAKNLHHFVFGDMNLDAEAGLLPKKRNAEEDELTKRERDFENRVLTTFSTDVSNTAQAKVEGIIKSVFKNTTISELVQKSLTKEVLDRVGATLEKDVRAMGEMNKLWKQAARAGYTMEWKDRILNAYLSRAKPLIPKIRQAVLAEAKISTKTQTTTKEEPVRISVGSNIPGGKGKIDPKKVDWNRTSEKDFLLGKATLKGQ